jgi:type I restriction enzyme R subunit
MSLLTESHVEEATLTWFHELGYTVLYGPDIAPGEEAAERKDYGEALLLQRLWDAVLRINESLPGPAIEDAIRKIGQMESPSLVQSNHAFHRMLIDGIDVEYQRPDGSIAGDKVRLVDFDDPGANDWLVVNQFTVVEDHVNRRPDVVVFVNGIPLSVIELKNPADENATIWSACVRRPWFRAVAVSAATSRSASSIASISSSTYSCAFSILSNGVSPHELIG